MSSKILIYIPLRGEVNKYKTYLGLLDSGVSASLADDNLFETSLVTKRNGHRSTWKTQIGTFSTSKVAEVTALKLPQFMKSRTIDANFHLFNKQVNDTYSFILGRDFLPEYWTRCPQLAKGIYLRQYPSHHGTARTLDPSSH